MGLPIFGPKLPKHGTFCPNSTQFYVPASCLETLGKQFAEIAELTLLVMSLPFLLPSFLELWGGGINFQCCLCAFEFGHTDKRAIDVYLFIQGVFSLVPPKKS